MTQLYLLSEGAMVLETEKDCWMFGAPSGVGEHLKEIGAELQPDTVMLTAARAPGYGTLGHETRQFKESPLRDGDISAETIECDHGTDYRILVDGAKILFSERGDVSVKDVEGYQLAIVKNKHRPDSFDDRVISWPWPNQVLEIVDEELRVSTKVWSDLGDVPDNLKKIDGVSLTLAQANQIAKVADAVSGAQEKWAVAISQFKKGHRKTDDGWVKREKELRNAFVTVFKDSASGKWRWAGITSVAVLDKHMEFMSQKAMDWAIAIGKVIGKGPLRFRHVPGLDGGECDRQARVGDFLFESGFFYDTPVGQAMRVKMQEDPTWQLSAGLLFGPKDLLHDLFFKRAAIFERSMTKSPAVPVTAILSAGGNIMEVKELTEEQLKTVAGQLEMDIKDVVALHTQALENGLKIKSVDEFAIALKAAKAASDDAEDETEEEEEEEEEMTPEERTKALKSVFETMSIEERKELRVLLDDADALPPETTAILSALKEQQEALTELTKTVSQMNQTTDSDLVAFFKEGPRRQKSSRRGKGLLEDGDVIKILKEIQEKVNHNPTQALYDMATSESLNAGGAQ